MRFVLKSLLIGLMVVGSIGIEQPAMAAKQLIEGALETDSDSVLLPNSTPGTVMRRNCENCNLNALQLTSESKFFQGSTAIDYATLRAVLNRSNRPHALIVFHRLSDRVVTRLVLAD